MQPHIVLSPSTNLGITISTTFANSFSSIPNDVVGGVLNIENADVRMRYDGTDPDTSGVDGSFLMKENGVWHISGRDTLVRMRFIAPTEAAFITAMLLKGE